MHLPEAGRGDRFRLNLNSRGELRELLLDGLERLWLGVLVETCEGGELCCLLRRQRRREDGS